MRLFVEGSAVTPNLVAEPIVYGAGIAGIEGDEERQNPGAFDMLEEPEAQALTRVRTFHDAGDVGDNQRTVIGQLHDAEIGLERSKRVIGDLRARSGDNR